MRSTKPVLLLFPGAGFSAHAGAPVMRDFWTRAKGALAEDILRGMGAGFYWAGYAMPQEDNLETAYGAAVFRHVVFGPDYRVATRVSAFIPSSSGPTTGKVVEAFERGIASVYGQAVLEHRNRWVGYYSEFLGYLLERFLVGVVTTNYDLVVETALQSMGRASTYSGTGAGCGVKDPIPILKLHGSVNWPLGKDHSMRLIRTTAKPQERAFVLPPTWNKDLTPGEPIAAVWRDAVELVSAADVALVIGHSFPSTDMHLDYLFAEGMSQRVGRPEHKRVIVADPNVTTGAHVCRRFHRYQTVEHAVPHGVRFEEILSHLQEGSIVL